MKCDRQSEEHNCEWIICLLEKQWYNNNRNLRQKRVTPFR